MKTAKRQLDELITRRQVARIKRGLCFQCGKRPPTAKQRREARVGLMCRRCSRVQCL